jgi:hypothetical protein
LQARRRKKEIYEPEAYVYPCFWVSNRLLKTVKGKMKNTAR